MTWLLRLATFLDPQARDTRGPVSCGNHIESWDNTVVHRAVPVPPQARPSREQACKALDDFAESIFWGFHMPDEYAGVTGKTGVIQGKDGRLSRFMTLTLTWMEPVFREKTRGDPEGRQCAVGMAHVVSL
ncbi:uncharacterized protein LY79DRAFT_513529 [Colletotrichum navitas]|uniref:Uncharacterized protein n=1 Tax=Colletotrichum navitas TaxID=681940 RepID=A0AAD8V6P2_9PEZI|nr:uncharacterized protein LY79DRAFT_513529 [Colletotrichum navitas]KAK1593781.1 hypothetical protein LY79DRAFT_513529 [Colletotrichum navitas]